MAGRGSCDAANGGDGGGCARLAAVQWRWRAGGRGGGEEEKEAGSGGPYAPVWLDLACEIELYLMITPLGAVASELAAELDRLGAGGAWGTWVVSGVSGVWGVRGK